MNTPGNKAAKKARRGKPSPAPQSGKRNAIAFEVEDIIKDARPGAYQFIYTRSEPIGSLPIGIIHACPCGCGDAGALYFEGRNPRKGGAEWSVSGEWPKATLCPSIGFYGNNSHRQGFHWHGYLTDGEFREL